MLFYTGSPTTRWASVALGAGVVIGAAFTKLVGPWMLIHIQWFSSKVGKGKHFSSPPYPLFVSFLRLLAAPQQVIIFSERRRGEVLQSNLPVFLNKWSTILCNTSSFKLNKLCWPPVFTKFTLYMHCACLSLVSNSTRLMLVARFEITLVQFASL